MVDLITIYCIIVLILSSNASFEMICNQRLVNHFGNSLCLQNSLSTPGYAQKFQKQWHLNKLKGSL